MYVNVNDVSTGFVCVLHVNEQFVPPERGDGQWNSTEIVHTHVCFECGATYIMHVDNILFVVQVFLVRFHEPCTAITKMNLSFNWTVMILNVLKTCFGAIFAWRLCSGWFNKSHVVLYVINVMCGYMFEQQYLLMDLSLSDMTFPRSTRVMHRCPWRCRRHGSSKITLPLRTRAQLYLVI